MEHKQLQFKADKVDASKGIFTGFASTTDLDRGGDIIVKGAFGRTLADRGDKVKVLWQHDMHMPIGRPTLLEERESGLYIEAQLSETTMGKDATILLSDGVIDSLSIGYSTKEADYNDDGIRIIKDLDLFEVSLVSFPMNEKALITSVKSMDSAELKRVIESALRDAGLSRKEAKSLISGGFKCLRDADNSKELNELSLAIKELKNELKV